MMSQFVWRKYNHLKKVELEDDSLRDGVQGSLMFQPDLELKFQILEEICRVGVEHVVLGFPASSELETLHVKELTQYLNLNFPKVKPWALCRINQSEITELIKINRENKFNIGASLFIALNSQRLKIENWNYEEKIQIIKSILSRLSDNNIDVCFNIEDATRTSPEEIKNLISVLCEFNISSIALCDTVGAASPLGSFELVKFVKQCVIEVGKYQPKILWHGHNDRGLALANALAAIEGGADIISGTFFGMGERAGNTALEQVAFILNEQKLSAYSLERLRCFAGVLSKGTGFEVPHTWPLVGAQVFSTSAGIHAAAIIKSSKDSPHLDYFAYGDIDPRIFNSRMEIRIGSTSGAETLKFLLKELNLNLNQDDFKNFLARCKSLKSSLSLLEFENLVKSEWKGHSE